MRSILLALPLVLLPASAAAVTCDGSELLCLDLTSPGPVTANGGAVVGGSFSGSGFAPSNNGGIDFAFPTAIDLSDGAIEFDVEGLLPLPGGETSGGKVSLFSVCGEAPDDNEYIGFQGMSPDYRDGHVFRFGQDDDGLADNWDAVVITNSEFGCAYNIQNWTAGQTHHVYAEWDPSGIYMEIDGGASCTHMGGGNGDAFDPTDKFLVVGNRCEHQSNQHPLASIRNLRVWGDVGTPGDDDDDDDDDATPAPCEPMITVGGVTPEAGEGSVVTFQARYGHCEGAETFRVVQMMIADEVTASDPNIHVGYGDGLLGHNGTQCAPGADQVIEGEWGDLDCSASGVWFAGNELVVEYALTLYPDTFGGPQNIFFDARGATTTPSPDSAGPTSAPGPWPRTPWSRTRPPTMTTRSTRAMTTTPPSRRATMTTPGGPRSRPPRPKPAPPAPMDSGAEGSAPTAVPEPAPRACSRCCCSYSFNTAHAAADTSAPGTVKSLTSDVTIAPLDSNTNRSALNPCVLPVWPT